jgi:hypothetical protein
LLQPNKNKNIFPFSNILLLATINPKWNKRNFDQILFTDYTDLSSAGVGLQPMPAGGVVWCAVL